MSALKLGELFAGYGGLGMGVAEVLDVDLAWVSEYDKGPSKILAHRFPEVPNHGDITKIDWSQVEPVDILTGGSPCQDLSHAGRRAGMTEGTRSNLWVAMREAIAQLRPGLVVWENVGGAFSAAASSEVEPCAGCVGDGSGTHLRALGRVLGDLSSLGYDARWAALRAADVGAPHGRLRVFVTAYPDDGAGHRQWTRSQPGRRGQALPDSERGGCDGRSRVEGREAFGGTATQGRGQGSLLPSPRTSDTNGAGQHGDGGLDLRTAVAMLPTPRATRGGSNTETCYLLPTPLNADAGPRGGTTGFGLRDWSRAHAEQWGQYAAAIYRWESLSGPAPSPTELSAKGNPRLSAAFSEWLMGLPAGWVTDVPGITRNEALKALGNGVCPQQCAAALRYLLAANEVAA